MRQEQCSMDEVLTCIINHEPVLSYGNLSIAGKLFADKMHSDM